MNESSFEKSHLSDHSGRVWGLYECVYTCLGDNWSGN